MDQQVADRRTETRVALAQVSVRATLRPGCSVRLLDLSPGGALVQSERPLRPGARVHMHMATSPQAFTMMARVLRCAVWALHPVDGVTYRGALQFETRCEWVMELANRPEEPCPTKRATTTGDGQ